MPNKSFEETINEFYLVTNEFCKVLESISSLPKVTFLSNVQKILNLVYLKASLISKPADIEDGEAEKFVQEADWNYIKDQVSSKLGVSDKYVELSAPENGEPENYGSVTLSECFADIYQDLRNFSTNVEIGNTEVILISVYECIENFEKFWGIRALTLLLSIHHLLYGGDLSYDDIADDEDDKQKTNSKDTSNWLINKRFNN